MRSGLLDGIEDVAFDKERLGLGHDVHELVFGLGLDEMGHDEEGPGDTHQVILPLVVGRLVLKFHGKLGQTRNQVEMLLDDDSCDCRDGQEAGDDVVRVVLPGIIHRVRQRLDWYPIVLQGLDDVDVDDTIERVVEGKRLRTEVEKIGARNGAQRRLKRTDLLRAPKGLAPCGGCEALGLQEENVVPNAIRVTDVEHALEDLGRLVDGAGDGGVPLNGRHEHAKKEIPEEGAPRHHGQARGEARLRPGHRCVHRPDLRHGRIHQRRAVKHVEIHGETKEK